MISLCPRPTDNHAPFAHRLVIPFTTIVIRTGPRFNDYRLAIKPNPPTFVICAFCDHWTKRRVPRCNCPLDCHNQSASE